MENYDVFEMEDNSYQIISGDESFKVEFDDENQKEMFLEFINTKPKNYKSLINMFLKKYDKTIIYSFFNDLKSSGIIFYEDNDYLMKGSFFEINKDDTYSIMLVKKSLGYISFGDSSVYSEIKKTKLGDMASFFDLSKRKIENMESFIKNNDFIVYDASRYNPNDIHEFNSLAFKNKKPWLLVQGVIGSKAYIGPLFYGEETGCYNCYSKRVNSLRSYLVENKQYKDWLISNNKYSKPSNQDSSYHALVASFVSIEIKKFLLDLSFPNTYGNLITFDFDIYQVNLHPLHKLPFCPVCYEDVEFSRAPWLSPVTLKEL